MREGLRGVVSVAASDSGSCRATKPSDEDWNSLSCDVERGDWSAPDDAGVAGEKRCGMNPTTRCSPWNDAVFDGATANVVGADYRSCRGGRAGALGPWNHVCGHCRYLLHY